MYVLRIGLDNSLDCFTDDRSAQEEAFAAFRYISKNPRIYQLFAKLPRDHPGIEFVHAQMADTISTFFVSSKEDIIPLDIIANHHATATLELFRWWIENDMKYSPQKMAVIHFEMIVNSSGLVLRIPRQSAHSATPIVSAVQASVGLTLLR